MRAKAQAQGCLHCHIFGMSGLGPTQASGCFQYVVYCGHSVLQSNSYVLGQSYSHTISDQSLPHFTY